MACEQCGFQNRDGTRFCVECGTALALRCPSCSAECQVGQKFCGECGTPLTGAPTAAPAASAPNAVRKTVTVLFADLGGSTGFGERADAEISRQVLARYHALLQETIDAHAGTVAKFMGDGMMATFGIPEVAEDDARRAVAAGADLQRRFEGFAADVERRHGETLTLRVGINTGEVVIGAGDADLIGDALNVAARLEKACRPGQVLVGEETWRLTRAEVAYEALGEVTVAGRAQPVAIYEVAADADAEPEVAAPFVGRDAEMERLVGVFDEARSEARARLVTVLGSPGVGKTRLSRELCARLGEHGDAASVELRCDRAGEATFAPVAQLIREASGVTDDHDPDAARAAIGALLPPADADHKRVVDVLAGLVGVGPARSVEETFWGVRRLVEATAADRPLVIVIDDIQWAEPLLLDLIEHLAEWVADAAVLVVGLARPELREVRPSLAEPGRPVAAVVVLDGLDASATEALAAGLLGASRLPAGFVDRLPESTDGNPLFVRELVRMLVDDRVIRRRDDGEWELTIDAEAVDVPPTIQSLLGARVERLPAPEREVLEYASVVGAEFSLGALRELAGARVALVSLLESMRRKEMVEPTGTYLGDEPVYRFHHVLIRDAAYRRLLKTTRAELHERVAVWTDRTAADLVGEHEAATAFHYEQAHRYLAELGALDEHGEELGRRAAELLTTAAQRALGRDDLASAGALSARALALLPDSDVTGRSDLLQMGCECLLASGDGAAAKPLVEELGRSAAADPRLAAWAECFAAQLVGLTDPDGLVAADAQAQAAAEALIELGDGSGQAKAHQVRAGLLARLGRVGDAELELDLALAAARAADDRRRVTAVLGAAPDAALFGPSPVARAGGRCLDVVRLLRITTASPAVEAASNRCQAVLESLRGRFDVSRSMLASARTALEELGLRHGIAQTELYAGMVEMIAGNPHAAIAPLRAAYAGLGTLGVGADAGQAAALLAIALLAEGDLDEAELMATESEALAGQNLKTAIGWRVARAEVLAARGELTAAVAIAEEAVAIAAGTDLVIDHADACVALASLRDRAGDGPGATAARADAKRLYEQKGATVPAERLDGVDAVAADSEGVAEPKPSPAAPRSLLRAQSNAAAEASHRLVALFTAHRFEECANLYAEDAHTEDRRSITGTDLVGRAGHVATFASAADLGAGETTFETIAVRGDRLVLGLIAMDFADWDVKILTVTQLDAEGRFTRSVWFDDSDLAEAVAELDEWYVAGEGADDERVLTAGAAWVRAINADDLDAIRALATDDFVWVDHRQLGWPASDVEGFLEMRRQYADVENRFVNAEMEVRGRAVLATTINRAVGPDGGAVGWLFFTASILSEDGRIERMETFDEEHRDAALARFDELSGEGGRRATGNVTNQLVARVIDDLLNRRYDRMRELLADDFVREDRRHGVSAPFADGPDEWIAHSAANFDVGFDGIDFWPIAARGEHLALFRIAWTSTDGRFVPFLSVFESDGVGRLLRLAHFDESDRAGAIAYFEARDAVLTRVDELAGGSSSPPIANAATRVFHEIVALATSRRFDEFASVVATDFERVDHRTGVSADLVRGPDAWAKAFRSTIESGLDRLAVESVAFRGERLALDRLVFTSAAGDEVPMFAVIEVDESGHLSFASWHDETALDQALAELDARYIAGEGAEHTSELRNVAAWMRATADGDADPRTSRAENAASRTSQRVLDLTAAGHYEEATACFRPDFTRIDRRHTVAGPTITSAREYMESFRAILEQFDTITIEPVAVRGDRLHLSRTRFSTESGFETVFWHIAEIDDTGLIYWIASHDEDDLAAALAELDERHLAGEGADHTDILRTSAELVRRHAARDWTALRDLIHPDTVLVDHRRLGWPAGDRDVIVQMWRELVELAPDHHMIVRTQHVAGRAVLTTVDSLGTSDDGGSVAWALHSLAIVDASGRITTLEFFDEGDWDAALARFDEFAAEPVDPRTPRVENAITRRRRAEWEPLIRNGRYDEARARMGEIASDELQRIDRRRTVAAPDADFSGVTDSLEAMYELGLIEVAADPIAVRGDRLALYRQVFRSAGGDELVILTLQENDATDRVVFLANYDETQVAEALAELDARYAAGEGAEHAHLLRTYTEGLRAMQAGDLETMAALGSPDFDYVDHRPTSFGALDTGGVLEMAASYLDVARTSVVQKVYFGDRCLIARLWTRGVTAEGAEAEWLSYNVWLADDAGRALHGELFAEDDWDAALARFDELSVAEVTRSAPDIANAASRVAQRLFDLTAADRYDEAADLLRPDFERLDRRHTVTAAPVTSGTEYLESIRAILGLYDTITTEPVAIRGESLYLSRSVFTDDGFETMFWAATELDADGRLRRIVNYDEDDFAAAMAQLDAWYVEGLGAEEAFTIRRAGDYIRSVMPVDGAATLALLHPDVRLTDHQMLGFGAMDFDGLRRYLAARAEQIAEDHEYFQELVVNGSTVLARLRAKAIRPDGFEALYELWTVTRFVAGKMRDADWFGLDDGEAARARFEELAAAPPPADLDNACVRALERLEWVSKFGDAPGAMDPLAPDVVEVDHRAGVGMGFRIEGRDGLVENFVEFRRHLGLAEMRREWLAVRGDRHALATMRFVADNGFEVSALQLYEIDPHGRLSSIDNYDVDDLDAAVAELDERYAAGEGAEHAELLRRFTASVRAYSSGDVAEMAALNSPDFEFVDHRLASWGTLSAGGFVKMTRAFDDVARTFLVTRVRVVGHTLVAALRSHGVSREGAEAEWAHAVVYATDPAGRGLRGELFDGADWDAALARFDELGAALPSESRTLEIENDATRAARLAWRLLAEGRFDELPPVAPGFSLESRRRFVRPSEYEDWRDALLLLVEQYSSFVVEPLAVRGSRNGVVRVVAGDEAGNESAWIATLQLDESDRMARQVNFDEEDEVAAIDLLDEWYIEDEGAADSEILAAHREGMARYHAKDWSGIRAMAAPDFEFVDHRPLPWPMTDIDGLLRLMQERVEQAPDFRSRARKLFVHGRAILSVGDVVGTDEHGGLQQWSVLTVYEIDAAGANRRIEYFAPEQWEAALARFDDLSAAPPDPRHPRAENAATTVADELARLVAENRLDEAERLFADGYVRIDRRAGVAAPDAHGGRAFVEAYRGFFDVGFDQVGLEYLAVRGDRLHLVRTRFETADGREVEFLQVAEFDEAGRASAGVNFDVDNLSAALEELDARYVASGAATEAEAALLAGAAALNRRDYEALTALLSPGFVSVDHSPLGFPPADRDVFVHEFMAGLDAMVPDNVRIVVKLFAAGDTVLFVNRVVGTTMDGGEYEWAPVYVTHRGPEGLIDRVDSFQPENWDVALARFDELAAAEPRDDRSLELENAATRDVGRIGLHLAVTGRFDEYRALLRPDVERVDRRRTVSAPPAQGIDAYMDALQWLAQFDSDRIEPLAVRGDRAAAYRVFVADEGGNEVAMIVAVLVDETARLVRQVNFDDDADGEIDAIDQIDEWYAEGEGVADSLGLSHHRDGMRRYHARDWDAMRAATTDDFELVDHRPLGWPLADADGWIRLMQERVAQVPDMRCAVRKVWARHGVGLSLIEVMGTDPDGGRFSWPSLQVSGPLSADGRNPRIEYFPIDDVDVAFARFDELAAAASEPAGPVLDNAAMRYLQAAQVFSSTPGRDVDEFAVRWLAEDVVRVDRRTGVSAPDVSGREAYADVFRAMREAFVDFTLDPVAIRGDRLALVATVGTSPDGFELPYLILVEVDDAGRAQFLAHFDESDLAGAFGQLDEQFLAGEGADHAQTLARHGDFGRAYAARDWTAVSALFAATAVVTGHRAIGQGWSNGDEFVASSRMVVELVPDVVHVARELEVRNSVILTNAETFGTTGDGNRYSWSYRMVVAYEAGMIARLELFDADDEESAQARFEELADADPRTPTIDNAAIRQMTRLLWLARFDFDRSPEMFSPDVAYTDHRAVVALPTLRGTEAMATVYTSVFEVYDDVVMEPTAVRGERLALYTLRMSTSGGAESGAHLLVGLDERGRIDLMVGFDEDDLLRAVEELDRRHHDVCGDAYPLAEAVYTRNALAASRGDYEPMAASHAADYVSVDHRLVGMGETDSAGQVEQTELMAGQLPGLVLLPARLYSSNRAVLTYMPIRGTTEDGSEYVWELAVVEVVDDFGQIVADHNFQIEQWDEALALFDEWALGP